MKLITHQQIKNLNLSPAVCVQWIKESFSLKSQAQLPAKISVHPNHLDFYTCMPCLLPLSENREQRFGVKVVRRLVNATPTLGSQIMLYNAQSGEMLSLLDGDWITTLRTGAVAYFAIQTLANTTIRNTDNGKWAFMGLGNTARATLLCLLESEPQKMHNVRLLRYKDHTISFMKRFASYSNVSFTEVECVEDLIEGADVIISCITQAENIICSNTERFKPGCLVVPIHTRGFQNCDLVFDKVYADDTDHVRNFKYFNEFKFFGELQDVVSGITEGRKNDHERILSYNIGLGLHDIVFASKIYDLLQEKNLTETEWPKLNEKYWV